MRLQSHHAALLWASCSDPHLPLRARPTTTLDKNVSVGICCCLIGVSVPFWLWKVLTGKGPSSIILKELWWALLSNLNCQIRSPLSHNEGLANKRLGVGLGSTWTRSMSRLATSASKAWQLLSGYLCWIPTQSTTMSCSSRMSSSVSIPASCNIFCYIILDPTFNLFLWNMWKTHREIFFLACQLMGMDGLMKTCILVHKWQWSYQSSDSSRGSMYPGVTIHEKSFLPHFFKDNCPIFSLRMCWRVWSPSWATHNINFAAIAIVCSRIETRQRPPSKALFMVS